MADITIELITRSLARITIEYDWNHPFKKERVSCQIEAEAKMHPLRNFFVWNFRCPIRGDNCRGLAQVLWLGETSSKFGCMRCSLIEYDWRLRNNQIDKYVYNPSLIKETLESKFTSIKEKTNAIMAIDVLLKRRKKLVLRYLRLKHGFTKNVKIREFIGSHSKDPRNALRHRLETVLRPKATGKVTLSE